MQESEGDDKKMCVDFLSVDGGEYKLRHECGGLCRGRKGLPVALLLLGGGGSRVPGGGGQG